MGSSDSSLKDNFHFAIASGSEGKVNALLNKHPELRDAELVDGVTNAMCRAAYLGHKNVLAILLKHGADVNKISKNKERTPLHWAVCRNDPKVVHFLLESGADGEIIDGDGYNAMDLAIVKMNYEAALALRKAGCATKAPDHYDGITWKPYDVEMFITFLDEKRENVDYRRFFDKIKAAEEEWNNKDLVVDIRETWGEFVKRQVNFEDPKMVPREDLPAEFQPHRSLYGKLANYVNGIDPYPQEDEPQVANPMDRD
jgi:hypothetical protein